MLAAYDNRTDIKELMEQIVTTYCPQNSEITVIDGGKYRPICHEDEVMMLQTPAITTGN